MSLPSPATSCSIACSPARLHVETNRASVLEGEVTKERAKREDIEARFAHLDVAYRSVKEQLDLLKRRISLAKAERVDTTQLEFEFVELSAKLEAIVREREEAGEPGAPAGSPRSHPKGRGERAKPKGRRPLVDADREPDQRVRIENSALHGVACEVGIETSFRIGFPRPRPVLIAVDRVKCEVIEPSGDASIVIAPVPRECMRRGILAPSMIARILLQKFGAAIPFHRQAKMLAADGIVVAELRTRRSCPETRPRTSTGRASRTHAKPSATRPARGLPGPRDVEELLALEPRA